MSQGQSKSSVADIGEDSQPIRNSAGKPFKDIGAARIALKKNPGYEIAKVEGGYELHPIPEGAATAANGNMAEPPRTGALEINDDLADQVQANELDRDVIASRYAEMLAKVTGSDKKTPDDFHYKLADAIISKDAYALEHLANGLNDLNTP